MSEMQKEIETALATIPANKMVAQIREILAVYDEETSVDQSIPIRSRFERLQKDFAAAADNDERAATRTKMNALVKDAGASRMRIQRAIKASFIGKLAFTKSQLEKDCEAAADHMKMEIDAQTKSAETLSLMSDVKTWVCFITAPLPEINKLAVACNDKGIPFENRGPVVDEPLPPVK